MLLGCLCLVAFVQLDRPKYLASGSVFLGLALWNKAIFLWALAGLVVAAALVLRDEIRPRVTSRNLKLAATGFLIGCSPFILYNLRSKSATLRENAHLDLVSIPGKFIHVQLAANGTALFGYMVLEEWQEAPKAATSVVGRASVWLREHAGERRESYFFYVLAALVLAVPLWWRQRAARFSLIFLTVAWLAMASTHDAGGAAHHVILLWPFPILFAVSAWRWARWLFALPVIMNLLVLNQYLCQFERNGPAIVFTDAIFPLAEELGREPGIIYQADWGMHDSLQLLHQGKLMLKSRSDELNADPRNEAQEHAVRDMLLDPDGRIISHTKDHEVYRGISTRLEKLADAMHLQKKLLKTIPDSNGRPIFEIFRYTQQ